MYGSLSSGREVVWGECSSMGYQFGLWSMSLARYAQASDITQNSLGHGDPPKVSLKLRREKSPIVIMHFAAVLPCRVTRL